MPLIPRLLLWLTAAVATFVLDVMTKIAPHSIEIYHYNRPGVLAVVFAALWFPASIWLRSALAAIGSGLMLGGFCGNTGQSLVFGYATDWIHLGPYFTNVADLAAALGVLCYLAGFVSIMQRRRRKFGA